MRNFEDAIQKAKHLAKTPEGQQLITTLQHMGGNDLENALEAASSGDYTPIQQEIARLLKDPQAKALLDAMGW